MWSTFGNLYKYPSFISKDVIYITLCYISDLYQVYVPTSYLNELFA
jgi:hypothetical protein